MAATPRGGKASDNRRRDLAKIHIAKKWMGLTDEQYRDWLFRAFGVRSAGQLDAQQRELVIKAFMHKGWRPMHKSARKSGMHREPSKDRAPQLSKIGALLANMDLLWGYADGISRRMYKCDKVRWLYPDQLRGVITALVKEQQSRARKKKNSTRGVEQ